MKGYHKVFRIFINTIMKGYCKVFNQIKALTHIETITKMPLEPSYKHMYLCLKEYFYCEKSQLYCNYNRYNKN